jgi:hypothetical protein
MLRAVRITGCWIVPALALLLIGCEDNKPSATSAPSASAKPPAPPPPPSSAPAPTEVAPKPSHACPDGSTGEGTFKNPCEAKKTARLMDVTWTGKMTDTGPSFKVTNKAKLDVVNGTVIVYFYDKAGKQLEVSAGTPNARPKQTCGGYIFGGPMKAGEKAVLTFSCVGKSNVPEGTEFVEAEMQIAGFPDADGKKADTYWRNSDLVPDARPKGGIK